MLLWFVAIIIGNEVTCSNDGLVLITFIHKALFTPPDRFKMSFGGATSSAHPLLAFPTTMVTWNLLAHNAQQLLNVHCFWWFPCQISSERWLSIFFSANSVGSNC